MATITPLWLQVSSFSQHKPAIHGFCLPMALLRKPGAHSVIGYDCMLRLHCWFLAGMSAILHYIAITGQLVWSSNTALDNPSTQAIHTLALAIHTELARIQTRSPSKQLWQQTCCSITKTIQPRTAY
eukprot:GHUV01031013.1.p1 GENE.GHUV01031013.1~~GHUV01031013.1.p1  ORF type:complete len:127 (+),score=11.91 GHUV01031013.1:592-972(+)